eukprot:Sdes_comp15473_c0_seq1m4379
MDSHHSETKYSRSKIICITLSIVAVAGLALGLGIGFGLNSLTSNSGSASSDKSNSQSPTVSPSSAVPTITLSSTAQPSPTIVWNGSQIIMESLNYTKTCSARPDADPALVQAAIQYILREIAPHYHDLTDRTGFFSKWDPFSKSTIAFNLWMTQTGIQCDDIKGSLDDQGAFLWDPLNGDSLFQWNGNLTGPLQWPGTTTVPVPVWICALGELCCLPRIYDHPQASFNSSWAGVALSFQRACAPRYVTPGNCTLPTDINCHGGLRGSGKFLAACNCLEVPYQDWAQYGHWSGGGADCRRVSPGFKNQPAGDMFGAAGVDMYASFAWATQSLYRTYGWCGQSYDLDQQMVLCDNADGECQIPFAPGIATDWTGYNACGKY